MIPPLGKCCPTRNKLRRRHKHLHVYIHMCAKLCVNSRVRLGSQFPIAKIRWNFSTTEAGNVVVCCNKLKQNSRWNSIDFSSEFEQHSRFSRNKVHRFSRHCLKHPQALKSDQHSRVNGRGRDITKGSHTSLSICISAGVLQQGCPHPHRPPRILRHRRVKMSEICWDEILKSVRMGSQSLYNCF